MSSESKSVKRADLESEGEVGDTGERVKVERLDEGGPVTRDSGARFSDSCIAEAAGAVEAGDIQREGGSPVFERSPGYARPDSWGEWDAESKPEDDAEAEERPIGTALARTLRPPARRRSSPPGKLGCLGALSDRGGLEGNGVVPGAGLPLLCILLDDAEERGIGGRDGKLDGGVYETEDSGHCPVALGCPVTSILGRCWRELEEEL